MTEVKISSLIEDKSMLQEIVHSAIVLRLTQVRYLENKNETNWKAIIVAVKNLDKQLKLSLPKEVFDRLNLKTFGE